MPSTVPILVQERPEPNTSWMKFVAVLCLIEFYVEFVRAGHSLWTEALHDQQRVDDPIGDIWIPAARIVRALSLYLLGRLLWLGRGRIRVWLVAAILAYAEGHIELPETVAAILTALMGVTGRAAIAKLEKKPKSKK